MDSVTSHLITFLVGGITGAAGHYLGEKYTDQRRRQEARSEADEQWSKFEHIMPEILASLSAALAKDPLFREIVVMPTKGAIIGGDPNNPRLRNESEHQGLRAKFRMLEEAGYLRDITPRNTPIYQMTEAFVQRLQRATR